jgi:hypothetical protein
VFRARIVISSICACILSVLWICYLYHKPSHVPAHQNVQAVATEASQSRSCVRKDLWVAQTPLERTCTRIESEKSFLVFRPKGNSLELFEELQNIRCWIQEKSSMREQQMRFFLAKDGLYRYRGQSFEAHKVSLSLYKLENTLSTASFALDSKQYSPFIRGTADKVLFSLQNGAPTFQAYQFQASLGKPPL